MADNTRIPNWLRELRCQRVVVSVQVCVLVRLTVQHTAPHRQVSKIPSGRDQHRHRRVAAMKNAQNRRGSSLIAVVAMAVSVRGFDSNLWHFGQLGESCNEVCDQVAGASETCGCDFDELTSVESISSLAELNSLTGAGCIGYSDGWGHDHHPSLFERNSICYGWLQIDSLHRPCIFLQLTFHCDTHHAHALLLSYFRCHRVQHGGQSKYFKI